MSDSNELYAFFENAFLNASKQGIEGLRVLGGMVWALQKGMGMAEFNFLKVATIRVQSTDLQ